MARSRSRETPGLRLPAEESVGLAERYATRGYVTVRDGMFRPEDRSEVAGTFDRLFDGWEDLPRAWAHQPAGGRWTRERPAVCEINHPLLLAPELAASPIVAACRHVAARLLGTSSVHLFHDHTVYKWPGADTAVAWHTDASLSRTHLFGHAVHCWVPLNDPGSGSLEYGIRRDDGSYELTPSHIGPGGFAAHKPTTPHRSGANLSSEVRRAWVLHFAAGWLAALRAQAINPTLHMMYGRKRRPPGRPAA